MLYLDSTTVCAHAHVWLSVSQRVEAVAASKHSRRPLMPGPESRPAEHVITSGPFLLQNRFGSLCVTLRMPCVWVCVRESERTEGQMCIVYVWC